MLRKSTKKAAKKVSFAEMGNEELNSMMRDFKKELQEIRFQFVTASVQNTARVSHLKKDIARIKTVLRQRQLSESKAPKA